jgi:predicted transglutaminase-like cysteine proteinase
MIKIFGFNIFSDSEIKSQSLEIGKLTNMISTLQTQVASMNSQILELTNSKNPKEDYYNNKYPKLDLTYFRVETDGNYSVDIRNFFNLNDKTIPIVTGKNDDEKALNGLKWVIKNITYTKDTSFDTYKVNEYWAYAYQTLKHKKGDCEDGAILLANILIKSGIPYWKVRLNAGEVNGGGHAYVVYYCEEKDRWVVLDWCYWENTLPINERKDYKEETNYFGVWFSWNTLYCFSTGLNTQAKEFLK